MKYAFILSLMFVLVNCSHFSKRDPSSVSGSKEIKGAKAEGMFTQMKKNPNAEVLNRFRQITGESNIYTVERLGLGQDACEKKELNGKVSYKCIFNANYEQEIMDREGYEPPPPDEPYQVQKEEYRAEFVELRY